MNIVLTGGTRGLGRCIAQKLIEQGHEVWIVARAGGVNSFDLPEESLKRIHWVVADLSNVEGLRKTLVNAIDSRLISLDGLVNNAATAYDDLITNVALPEIEHSFRVNVFAPMELTRFVIRNMLLHGKGGSLVHISSICSRKGYKGLSMYASTKGALESFSRGVAREWGGKGIRSNCVVPGFMETEMSSSLSVDQREKIYRRTSLGKATDLTSVADAVCFLLGDGSKSITGQDIVVDSGTV